MSRIASKLTALALAGAGTLGVASWAMAQGDGSGTDNPDLLRGSLGVGCPAGTLCDFPPTNLMAAPALQLAGSISPGPAPAPIVPNAQIASEVVAAEPQPRPVPTSSGFDVSPVNVTSWDFGYGIGVRGVYVRRDGDEDYELVVTPQVSASRQGASTLVDLGASADLVAPRDGEARVGGANVEGTVAYRLSPSAGLAFDGTLSVSQDDPDGIATEQANVAEAPRSVTGSVGGAYSQRLGKLDTTVSAGLSRSWTDVTRLEDGSEISNAEEAYWGYEGGLRLGYAISPIVTVFADGDVGRTDYNARDPDAGARRSSWDYALRAGVTANWSDVVTAEASVGSGWRDFDSSAFDDARTWLYGVALGYGPNPTTQLRLALDTTLDAGSGAEGADTVYALSAQGSYRVNSWVALRADASAQWDVPVDGGATTRRYGAGVGADWTVGPHATASLDYDYGWREDPDAAESTRDEHRVSGGVTLRD